MEGWMKNKLVWVVAALFVMNIGGFLMGHVIINKTADRVIEKLQKEYSPAKPPYGPGLNPDAISNDAFQKSPVVWSWERR